ncbi:MAG TPA: GAF domain-containing sensor histidine kinase, partial [Herpetosiphonaceae bacterium]|nr:GAF domain-containing sensor histidine kinase [Herpetosiphonaceae bacterium]
MSDATDTHATNPDQEPGGPVIRANGMLGAMLQSHDWATTPLGPPEAWPASLRSALSICLNSRFPIAIYWGSELALVYNDAWRPILGDKHPWALGQPAAVVWPEIWAAIGPLFATVVQSGEGVWQHDQLLLMHRHGYTEECYFNFTFSPIWGENGQVAGIFNAVIETTQHVIGARRLHTLRDLGSRTLTEATTVAEACRAVAMTLAGNPFDVPFSVIYLLDDSGDQARVYEAVSLAPGTAACPQTVTPGGAEDRWGFGRLLSSQQPALVVDLDPRAGPWPDDAASRAVILPLAQSGLDRPAGFLVAGISPRLPFDQDYQSFLDLAAGHLATAIANARAYAAERQRAEALALLDQAKTAFFSNISHEFRTPLTLMLGPLEDLQRSAGAWPAAEQEWLALVQRNAGRLLKLVNTLLDFSRIEAGRLEAVYEPTDLAVYTTDLASVFRSTMERAGLAFRVDCPPLDQPVAVDREMWEKIVFNLLSNAFKFTFAGAVTLTLRQHGDTVALTISDTGTGIPADELPHLFERFHRVKGARGRSFEGSGIGLALVQELVRLHGGTITVASAPEQGSTFAVTLPLRPAAAAPARGAARAGRSPRAAGSVDDPGPWVADDGVWSGGTIQAAIPELAADRPAQPGEPPPAQILLADDNA